jgi:hypothetical protein
VWTGRRKLRRASCHGVVPGWRAALGCALTFSVAACGSTAPTAPVPPLAPTEITISVTATGFKPKESEIALGGRARFENIDDRLHSIASNPLISHADCPPINEVGILVPGQSKLTGAFTEAKTCGYHDTASEGTGQLLMGTITVR